MSQPALIDPAGADLRPAPDWSVLAAELDDRGYALIPGLLAPPACQSLVAAYSSEGLYRKRIVMSRHGYGQGEYQYFAYPLPKLVASLRARLYPPLAAIANRWNEQLGLDSRYPAEHAAFLERCHQAGQTRPTPLLLKYESGDYNCLHQDLYGAQVFPLQVTALLSRPGRDFTGGELVLTEQSPRRQSRVEVVPLALGDAVVFPVNHRPVAGKRGHRRVKLRHGVSRLRSGQRYTLGIIFHDAE